MNYDELFEMWEKDSVIEMNRYEDASINGARLHAKYLRLYSEAKMIRKKLDADFDVLIRDKKIYFDGKMSNEEIRERGWKFDPFDGLKVLKSDIDKFMKADPDVVKAELAYEEAKIIEEALKEMLDALKWRYQTIRNILEWRKFEAGV